MRDDDFVQRIAVLALGILVLSASAASGTGQGMAPGVAITALGAVLIASRVRRR